MRAVDGDGDGVKASVQSGVTAIHPLSSAPARGPQMNTSVYRKYCQSRFTFEILRNGLKTGHYTYKIWQGHEK
jgi:hypothetical protein